MHGFFPRDKAYACGSTPLGEPDCDVIGEDEGINGLREISCRTKGEIKSPCMVVRQGERAEALL